MSRADEIREGARETGRKTLEVHAGTPRLNDWYFSKFAERIGGRVLELGSGLGNLSRLLAERASELVVTDVEEGYVAHLEAEFAGDSRVRVERYDLEGPPPPTLAGAPFDVIISLNVLEHVLDDRRAVRDLAGLLAPGGWLLTYVPACPSAYGTLDEALGHHRRYDRASLAALMESADLRVERLEFMNPLGLVGWVLNGRVLGRRVLDPRQVRLFERIVPLARLGDRLTLPHFPLPIGLGLVCHARRAAG